MGTKMTREQQRTRREALLAKTRSDMERAKKIGERADRIYGDAMRRRFPILA